VTIAGGPSASTNASGTYTLADVVVGTHTVSFSKSGYVSASREATVTDADPVNVDLTMQASVGAVAGKVTDASGPLAGVSVQVASGPSTTTDGSGSYSFSGLTPGAYALTFSHAGYTSKVQSATVTLAATTTVDVTLVAETPVTPPAPARKKLTISTPTCPSTVTHRKAFTVSGTVIGSGSLTGRANIKTYYLSKSKKWVYSKTYYAHMSRKNSSVMKYTDSISISSAGSWRLVASYPGDSKYLPAISGNKSVRVK
jgi:hypothetical protein